THDHEAGMQSHPEGQVYIAAGRHGHRVRLDRASDVERGQYRPARVVLVRDRRAEQRHETVAQELIDSALVAMDLSQRAVAEAGAERGDFLAAWARAAGGLGHALDYPTAVSFGRGCPTSPRPFLIAGLRPGRSLRRRLRHRTFRPATVNDAELADALV